MYVDASLLEIVVVAQRSHCVSARPRSLMIIQGPETHAPRRAISYIIPSLSLPYCSISANSYIICLFGPDAYNSYDSS
jgi:hypothetical protein